MVNNSININKSLNSDGQQFYQYQQNEQPHHLKSLNIKNLWKTNVGNLA